VTAVAAERLQGMPLFDGLSDAELVEFGTLMAPWTASCGDALFHQGDPGDRLLILGEGELEVAARLPDGRERILDLVQPGEIVGELALLTDERRAATIRATTDSTGMSVSREAFELLRLQCRPVALMIVRRIGEAAMVRLMNRSMAIAAELAVATQADHRGALTDGQGELDGVGALEPADPAVFAITDEYLLDILFFRRFSASELAFATDGLPIVHGPRGASLPDDPMIWIVLRGAVETWVLGEGGRQRVRLAGPGRCIGHTALHPSASALPARSALRERAVLMGVPLERMHDMLAGASAAEQRFSAAFFDDVARALHAAEASVLRSWL
jgi:CRP-like cAMP-binding protein